MSRDSVAPMGDITAGEIQVVITPAGDPGTELIRTEPTTLLADDRVFVSLFDSAGDSTLPYVVVLTFEGGAVRLVDDAAPVRLEVAHAAPAEASIDVYVEPEDGALTTPLFGGLVYGAVGQAADVPAADDIASITATLTPAGDPGVVLLEQLTAVPDGVVSLLLIAGAQADESLRLVSLPASRRPVADGARISLYNAIREQDRVDIYLLEPGATFDRETSRPLIGDANFGAPVNQFRVAPGTYSLYVVRDADDAVLLGPRDVVLAAGDVVQLVTTDTADPNVSALLEIDLAAF